MQEKEFQKPYVIGIAGGSGAGKTFFLKCFLKTFAADKIGVLSLDDYYIPSNTKTKEENKHYNFDLPSSFYRENFHQDLLSLMNGETILRQEYTFNNPELKPKILKTVPARILLVEGLFIYHYEEINKLLDHRIFIHADKEIALKRRLKRDFIERGYPEEDVRYKWENHVVPAFNKYLLPYQKQCDQLLTNNTDDAENLMAIAENMSAYLKQSFF